MNGATCLHRAAGYGHASIVTALLRRGADINAQDNYVSMVLLNSMFLVLSVVVWVV